RGLVQSGVAGGEPLHAAGLGGQGQIVAVADSGLTVTCDFEDPANTFTTETIDASSPPLVPRTSPLHRKIQAYQDILGTNFTDEIDTGAAAYHGTFVAGVVAADRLPW